MTEPKNDDKVLQKIADAIDAIHEASYRQFQYIRLPLSDIGNDCHRDLWMTFRWASPVKSVTGQRVRIFRRGDREEDRIIADLREAGVHVYDKDDTGKQIEYTIARGHAVVRLDGVITDPKGVLLSSTSWVVLEAKSHNKAQFSQLVRHGIKKSHPKHYAQCQIAMREAGLEKAVYYARCKDNEEDRPIEIDLEKSYAEGINAKAELIVNSTDAPVRISIDPSFYRCRMCANQAVCHGLELPLRNCRTCARVEVRDNGEWGCSLDGRALDKIAQQRGCGSHRWNPSLINGIAEFRDKSLEWVQYKLPDGTIMTDNGVSR